MPDEPHVESSKISDNSFAVVSFAGPRSKTFQNRRMLHTVAIRTLFVYLASNAIISPILRLKAKIEPRISLRQRMSVGTTINQLSEFERKVTISQAS